MSLLNPCSVSSSSVTGTSALTPLLLLTEHCHLFTCDSPCSSGNQWSNISELMLSAGFPKAPGHSQPPIWISSGNTLKIWRFHFIQQLSEREVNKCLKMIDSLKGGLTYGIIISFSLSSVAGEHEEVEAEGIATRVELFYQYGLHIHGYKT